MSRMRRLLKGRNHTPQGLRVLAFLCCLLSASVQTSTFSHHDDVKQPKAGPAGPIVVVGAVNGMTYVLDARTGHLVRSFDTGGASISAFRSNEKAPLLVASANAEDAQLFMIAPQHEATGGAQPQVQQLNSSLQELVRRSPFRDLAGHLYVGSQDSRLFASEFATAKVHRFGGSLESLQRKQGAVEADLVHGGVFVGRTEYVVRAFDGKTGGERFNISVGEFTSAFRMVDQVNQPETVMNDLPHHGIKVDFSVCSPLRYVSTVNGALYAFSYATGRRLWKAPIPSTSVAVFTFVQGSSQPCERRLNDYTTFCSLSAGSCLGGEAVDVGQRKQVIISDYAGHAFAIAAKSFPQYDASEENPFQPRLSVGERQMLPAPEKKAVEWGENIVETFKRGGMELGDLTPRGTRAPLSLLDETGLEAFLHGGEKGRNAHGLSSPDGTPADESRSSRRPRQLTWDSKTMTAGQANAPEGGALEPGGGSQGQPAEGGGPSRVYEVVSATGKAAEIHDGTYELSGTVDAASALTIALWPYGANEHPPVLSVLTAEQLPIYGGQPAWKRFEGPRGYPQLTHVDANEDWGWLLRGQIVLAILAGVLAVVLAIAIVWSLRQPRGVPLTPVVVTRTLEVRSAIEHFDKQGEVCEHQSEGQNHSTPGGGVVGANSGAGGNVLKLTNHILGYGSNGTIVYQGEFNGRPVAVKRLLSAFYNMAEKEISLLIASDEHPNILRYYAKEADGEFVYLVLELCRLTLVGFIEGPEAQAQTMSVPEVLDPKMCSLLEQLVQGVAHLHDLHIVHRDLKPANILISEGCKLKISDMGLGRKLTGEQSFSQRSEACGSEGWQAPEMMQCTEQTRLTKAVDIFSLGCMMYYMLSDGAHPFGKRSVRQNNIACNKYDLRHLRHLPTARHLVEQCISGDAWRRPTAREVLNHPLFWDAQHTVDFLQNASDRIDIETAGSKLDLAIEKVAKQAIGKDWSSRLDSVLMGDLRKHRSYRHKSLRDLLRVIRNKAHHWRGLPEELQIAMGPYPEGFLRYFTTRFPSLLTETWHVLKIHCQAEPMLQPYYNPVPRLPMPTRKWWPRMCVIM